MRPCLRAAARRVCSRHARAPACAHAQCAPSCSHARRARGRVCRVLARNGLVRRSTSPATRASERAMRSRAVKPRCSKSLSLGFPEVMPKTARHAGCLFQGKAGFCAVRLWLPVPSSHYPFALCALAGSVCWLCACLCAATMRHALLRCAPPRSACPCGSHAQHRQVRDVAVRAHATFATTRPGVCPLPQASATAPLHWPLTTPSRASVSPHIVSDIPTNTLL